jgi:isopentenyldiphosphate isomerase
MAKKLNETEFIKHIRSEKLKAEETRTTYTLKKLAYATALLGIGSLNINVGQIDLSMILYLVPWVALAFDLYILGEDYSVKRFGAFLGANSPDALERLWEKWVSENRDPFAPLAMPILTTLLLLAAATVIWVGGFATGPVFWGWLVLSGLPSWILFIFYRSLRKRTLRRVESVGDVYPQPSESLQRLRSAVEGADHCLNRVVYDKAKSLFTTCVSSPQHLKDLLELAPEYGKPEFLVCVDNSGAPVYSTKDVVEDFREMVIRYPSFERWFQEATIQKVERPVLLVARWLCHLVGFRHVAVHLFMDHPALDDHTFAQVRGFSKFESPGCFDLPVAGHAVGLESVKDTLFKELEEELNWSREDVCGLEEIGNYNYCAPLSDPSFRNTEFRVVFQSRLKADSLIKMRFVDREVAAISIFSLSELQALISSFPERVASGLRESFPVYLKAKEN